MKKTAVIIFRETMWQSIISDTYTFAMLGGLFWINQTYCGGSYFINGFIIISLMVCVFAKASTTKTEFSSADEAITHLTHLKRRGDIV